MTPVMILGKSYLTWAILRPVSLLQTPITTKVMLRSGNKGVWLNWLRVWILMWRNPWLSGPVFSNSGMNYLQITRNQRAQKALFWEQFTSQLNIDAFGIEVVRFMTLIRKTMTPLLRGYVFAPNAPFMWRAMHRELQPYYDLWQAQNCIYAYVLQTDRDSWMSGGELMGAVLNTGLEMDQGIYRG